MLHDLATIQFDLDGKLTLDTHYGIIHRPAVDRIILVAVDQALALCEEFAVTATFFFSAADLEDGALHEPVRRIAAAGHEIANHGYTHALRYSSFTQAIMERDIARAQDLLSAISGTRARGFKAPNYEITDKLLDILEEKGFTYDCSLFPTYWGSAVRWLQGLRSNRRIILTNYSGHFIHGMVEKAGPYRPASGKFLKSGNRNIIEIPISVSPVAGLKLPIHSSFLLPLPANLADSWLDRSLQALQRYGQPLVFPIHAWELADISRSDQLYHYFRSFGDQQQRIDRIKGFLSVILNRFEAVTTADLAERFRAVRPRTATSDAGLQAAEDRYDPADVLLRCDSLKTAATHPPSAS
ncbi:polysaccharide deacetylase family protein [bacterium]|nr:polysaccharide deacetylase family protein [candidate division CSSED10-310 bacterium]